MWTEENLLFTSEEYYRALLEAVDVATHSIMLESYIFLPDQKGTSLLEKLVKKTKDGVKVRIVIDGLGSRIWSSSQIKRWKNLGIEIRIFHPILWPVSPRLLKYFFSRINHRDHRKLCIIDERCALISSFNVMDESFQWKEMGVMVKGDEIETLTKTFEVMWQKSYAEDNKLKRFKPIKGLERLSNSCVQFNYTKKMRRSLNKRTLERIESANRQIWIITPYFVPPLALIKSLKAAKKKGVDIKIILPSRSDVPFIPWINLYFIKVLLAVDIQVFKYQPSILHAKFLLIDDWLTIGSMNLNHRSFYLDVETNVVLRLKSTLSKAHEHYLGLLEKCIQVHSLDVESRNPFASVWIRFILLLRGWL